MEFLCTHGRGENYNTQIDFLVFATDLGDQVTFENGSRKSFDLSTWMLFK